ncbi:MAG: hypothetical protein JW986_00780 [Methanotrichaceae archaeon]|nr:hypothetical protein [Methanotrichaceae archaeon]
MTGLRGAEDLARYIQENYSGRVVEVGAGHLGDVARQLFGLEVVATDIEARRIGDLSVKADDIFDPSPELYKGARLIYSIRPPVEMQPPMGRLALSIGADLIIRPLGDEIVLLPGLKRRLVNLGQARFYLYKAKE